MQHYPTSFVLDKGSLDLFTQIFLQPITQLSYLA